MSGNLGRTFVAVENSELKERTIQEFIDMGAEIVLDLEEDEAEIIVADHIDFNHFHKKCVDKIVFINLSEKSFESILLDAKSMEIKKEMTLLKIPM